MRTNQGRFFKPQRTRDYEDAIAWICRSKREKFGDSPVNVAIELSEAMTVVVITPAERRRKLQGDIDNYAKSVLDGLQQGGMIENDRQVSSLNVSFRPIE